MLSFGIAARNEAPSVRALADQIEVACLTLSRPFEILVVDDGSQDGTWAEMLALSAERPYFRGIRLRRNFGKGPALSAGIAVATGEIICMMDADLQDDAADLGHFLRALDGGADLAVGWRHQRKDSWFKNLQSKIFNFALALSGLKLHDHNCGFKVMKAEVLHNICLYGDMHRYLPILAHINGYAVTEVRVNHRARQFGRSNYGLGRTLRGFFDLLTILFLKSYRHRPMHFLGTFGLFSFLIGIAGMTFLAAEWCLGFGIGSRPLLMYSAVAAMLGAQILATGLLAELLTRNMVRSNEIFSVRDDTRLLREVLPARTLQGATVYGGHPLSWPHPQAGLDQRIAPSTAKLDL